MNRFLHGVARATFESFEFSGPVLEVGSFQVEGQEPFGDLRPFFDGESYIGLDMRPGPGVDCVGSIENLPFPSRSLGTVIAMSTFEHVQRFWKGFDEIYRVLRPDGALLVSCPFHFHIHSYPSDYWRFTPESLKFLLDRYPSKIIGYHGPADRPSNVWAVAFREEYAGSIRARLDRYRELLGIHAREPLPLVRRLKYQLGRVLCGRRPFAPWLLREKWHVELQESFAPWTRETHEGCPSHVSESTRGYTYPEDEATESLPQDYHLHRELELPEATETVPEVAAVGQTGSSG